MQSSETILTKELAAQTIVWIKFLMDNFGTQCEGENKQDFRRHVKLRLTTSCITYEHCNQKMEDCAHHENSKHCLLWVQVYQHSYNNTRSYSQMNMTVKKKIKLKDLQT